MLSTAPAPGEEMAAGKDKVYELNHKQIN